MIAIEKAVTGGEVLRGDGGPLDALVKFYRCFNSRDLHGLSSNWLGGDAPSMDNPIGGIRRGWEEISAGYRRLFEGPAKVAVEFYDYTTQQGPDWALFVGRERGVCESAGEKLDLAIRTTRWFVLREGVWRQLHHHGSIERSGLLSDYQRIILGAPL
jgi:hypothetical protein